MPTRPPARDDVCASFAAMFVLQNSAVFAYTHAMRNANSLIDPYRHMEWANALLWTLIVDNDKTRENDDFLRRMRHIHQTESAFLQVWKGESIGFDDGETSDPFELVRFARGVCGGLMGFVATVDPSRFDEVVTVPWARRFGAVSGFESQPSTLFDTIFQLCAHGVHHRAQINTLFRGVNVTPPFIDYIGWVWRGRPDAVWPDGPV